MIKESSTCQKRRYEEKQREKKLSIKKHSIPRFGLGGLSHTKKKIRITRRARYVDKYQKTRVYGTCTFIVFEPIPDKIQL
jgi:hypothetical protein